MTSFSFSLLEAVLLKKFNPRMDFDELDDGKDELVLEMLLVRSGVAEVAEVVAGPEEADLREKKGIPEGVPRGLGKLERDWPGVVAFRDGSTKLAMAVLLLLLLLELEGRFFPFVAVVVASFDVSAEDAANRAISLVEAAIR